MTRRVEFHPAAVEEAAEARDWYSARNEDVAAAFLAELDRIIARIGEDPSSLPVHEYGTRRCSLRRFPYLAIFRETVAAVQVVAVAHARLRPNYWRARLRAFDAIAAFLATTVAPLSMVPPGRLAHSRFALVAASPRLRENPP